MSSKLKTDLMITLLIEVIEKGEYDFDEDNQIATMKLPFEEMGVLFGLREEFKNELGI